MIEKTVAGSDITPAQLEKINKLARRELAAEDLFVFSVILCDNEIDRDGERFPKKSLEALAELYCGKTGIFDHSAQAKNQSARIFETELVSEEHIQAPGGEIYTYLKAWAYMARCEKNADLILEIDAGIKKEVSVGCAVRSVVCSVCGADQKSKPCQHRKGASYGGVICHHALCEPTDAYEWSFVAVPAQRNAGVTKGYMPFSGDLLERIQKSAGAINLTESEAQVLKARLAGLDELCKAGEEYTASLRRNLLRKARLAQPGLDPKVLEEVSEAMNISQLKAFCSGFEEAAAAALPRPQLGRINEGNQTNDREFLI